MTQKRYRTKFAFVGDTSASWANDGPVVWADNIHDAATEAHIVLTEDRTNTNNHPARIVAVEEIPYYTKD